MCPHTPPRGDKRGGGEVTPKKGAALSPPVAGWRHTPGSHIPAGLVAGPGVPSRPPGGVAPHSQSTVRVAGGARGPRPALQL